MIYKIAPKTGDKLSILGMGCMRFPRRAGGTAVDEEAAERLVIDAIGRGINLFDTAYIYPGSEKALGKALSRAGVRDSVIVQTKAPSMTLRDIKNVESVFETQLARLQTDYIDHYLLHHLDSFADYERLRDMGIEGFFERERARGRARRFGFSFHGNVKEFKRIIDAYPWDVCVIQYNYLDERYQAGTEGMEYAADKGLAVIAMEPLRGGLLGDRMPAEARKLLRGAPAQAASLALRWVWSHPGVTSALSGMSERRHIEENCAAATAPGSAANADAFSQPGAFSHSDAFSLSDAELNAVEALKAFFARRSRVPCTACAYCLPCPSGVDIPTCFALYNTHGMTGSLMSKFRYVLSTEGAVNGSPTKASLCVGCGACERRCPQHIAIRDRLKEVAREMEKPHIRYPSAIALRAAAGVRFRFKHRSVNAKRQGR